MLLHFFYLNNIESVRPIEVVFIWEHLICFLLSVRCQCHWLTKAALQIGQKLPWKIVNKPFPINKTISNGIDLY